MPERIGIVPDDLKKIGTELKFVADYESDLVPADYLQQIRAAEAQRDHFLQNGNERVVLNHQDKNGSETKQSGSVGFGNRRIRKYVGGFGNLGERK